MRSCTVSIQEVLKDPNLNLSAKHWCDVVEASHHPYEDCEEDCGHCVHREECDLCI